MKLQNKKTGRILTKYSIRALEGVDADNGYDEGCEWYINDEVNHDLETLFGREE